MNDERNKEDEVIGNVNGGAKVYVWELAWAYLFYMLYHA